MKIRYALTPALAAALLFALPPAPSLRAADTTTPIKYVVVIFDENNSFDHYFGTYPNATNPSGEPAFNALPGTPSVNGLTPALLANNPNSVAPFRLDRSQEALCDNDNHYTDEQNAYHGGLLDRFPESTNGSGCPAGSNRVTTTATPSPPSGIMPSTSR